MDAIWITAHQIGSIRMNEIQSNLYGEITAKRYHIVHFDRSVYVPGESAKGYDLTNSWIYSTNDLNDAHTVAAWHYADRADEMAQKGIDKPILIIDAETASYVDISDEAVYAAHNAAKIANLAEEALYREIGMIQCQTCMKWGESDICTECPSNQS